MELIKLTLSAPLQSWGEDSRWDNRGTAAAPTKSAIVGMLGSCLGYPRGDSRLAELDSCIHMAVRTDRAGRVMTDFHTVQGTDHVLMNAAGGKRPGDTIITPRQYLQDAVFTVYLWGDADMLSACEDALHHPRWLTFLGRKSCVPSVPMIPVRMQADTIDDAVRQMTDAELARAQDTMQVEIELLTADAVRDDEHVISRPDRVIRADLNEYGRRRVRACAFRKEDAIHVSE